MPRHALPSSSNVPLADVGTVTPLSPSTDSRRSAPSQAHCPQVLHKLADLIEANLEEMAAIESLDNGKPLAIAKVGRIGTTGCHPPLDRRHC